MKAEFTIFDKTSNWVEGKVDKYKFDAKLYNKGSDYGINDGRVSKLIIYDNNNVIVDYDRGDWSIEPELQYIEYYNAAMKLLESSAKRFSWLRSIDKRIGNMYV